MPDRKPLISGNWKMNLNHFEATATLDKLRYLLSKDDYQAVDVSVHPPFTDIRTVQTFLETNGLNWPTIFQTEADKRGWTNPVATHYGIQSVPMYWVVSSKGNVVEISNNVQLIEPLLRKLMVPKQTSENGQN